MVMAAAGRLWLAEMEKGKYLVKKSAALPKITEESLAEAFSSLSGIGEREIILIYNSPDLHTACRTFPAMSEEELEEYFYDGWTQVWPWKQHPRDAAKEVNKWLKENGATDEVVLIKHWW